MMASNHDDRTKSDAQSSSSSGNINNPVNLDPKSIKIQIPQASEINHGDQLNPSNSVQILLIRPSAADSTVGISNAPQPDQTIRIHFHKTRVQDLKVFVFQNWKGKPKTDGIRLIARGRILNDSEVVGEALGKPPDDSSAHAIHVVVRPNAWTEKTLLTSSRSVSAPPITTTDSPVLASSSTRISTPTAMPKFSSTQPPTASVNPTNPLRENVPSSSSEPTSTSAPNASNNLTASSAQLFVNYFCGLTAYGKVNFLQNILQARFKIVERVEHLRRQIHDNHLSALGMTNAIKKITLNHRGQYDLEWKAVEEKIIKLLTDLNAWNYSPEPIESVDFPSNIQLDAFDQSGSEFKRVEIAGLPYLLYIPQSLTQETSHPDSTKLAPDSQLKVYKTLQRELNRTLHLEAQIDVLILQAQKMQAGLNQLDYIMSATGLHQTGNYAQRLQNMAHNHLGVAPPPVGPAHPFPPAPPNAPAAGLGFGFGMGADGLVPPNNFLVPNGPLWQHPVARVRRYEFTINLDSIRRYLAPLLWLSLKLSVLLYIFGRHASASKLVILIMFALGWVLWEAFSINQRHEAQARRRERIQQRGQQALGAGAAGAGPAVDPIQAVLDRGRRRAERERLQQILREQRQRVDGPLDAENQAPAPPPNNPPPAMPAPAQPAEPPVGAAAALDPAPRRTTAGRGLRAAAAHIRARGGAFPPGTEVRPFRNTSPLSPKYWFNSIAVVGLASEYRELGLHSIGERAMGASNIEYPRWYRYLRNTKTCLVLFFGTLLPEVEKKRRKALEKRARILDLVIADAARDTTTRNRNQDLQRVAAQVGDNNSGNSMNSPLATSTPRPTLPRSSDETPESSGGRVVKSGEDFDNQLTPRATRVTALETIPSGSNSERSSLRRSKLVPESDASNYQGNQVLRTPTEPTLKMGDVHRSKVESVPRNSISIPGGSQLGTTEVENNVLTDTVTNASSVPSASHSVPNCGSLGDRQELPQEATIDDSSALLPSPVTPMDPPQVLGGLDDTDDEEIIGNDNDEPGMLLF